MTHLRIGTRTSQLALWQTEHVAAQLSAAWRDLTHELCHLVTQGDRRLDRALPEIGGKGLFTAELEDALRDGTIDAAVHSLKDLPVEDADGLTVGAILRRADARDVLVARRGVTLATLPPGAVVGTSSLRRQAQLLAIRPDIVVKPIRGNVDTRLRKVSAGEYDAAVMAAAGLVRLGLEDHIAEWLTEDVMLPAPGQGAIAVQCRAGDTETLKLLAAIDDAATRLVVTAERRLLSRLGGGCSAPIAALASGGIGKPLRLIARVVSVDGKRATSTDVTASSSTEAADAAALDLFAQGAGGILAERSKTPGPLRGKRIVITRPADQVIDFASELALEGATPLVMPVIQTAVVADLGPVRATVAQSARFDWILFTSVNAVRYFFDLLPVEQAVYKAILGGTHVAAVGTATAACLEAMGVQVHVTPEKFTGVALAAAIPGLLGARVLLPRSALGSAELPWRLAESGAEVTDLPIYTTVNAPLSAADLAQLAEGVDAVTFTSGSTVRGLVEAVQATPRAMAALTRACIACIGPSTASAVKELGLDVAVVAREHTVSGLIAGLRDYYRQRE